MWTRSENGYTRYVFLDWDHQFNTNIIPSGNTKHIDYLFAVFHLKLTEGLNKWQPFDAGNVLKL